MLRHQINKLKNDEAYRNSFIYLIASLIGFGIPFLQHFLFGALLEKEGYGRLVVFFSLFGIFSALFGFGIGTVIQRFYYDKTKEELIKESFSFWAVCGIILVIIILLLGKIGYAFIENPPFNYYYYILLVLSSLLFSVNLTFFNYYIVSKNPIKYAIHLISGRLLLFIGLILVYILGRNTIEDYIKIYFIATIIIFIGTIIDFKINPFKISLTEIKSYFKFSYPLMINSLGGIGYSHGYKLILKLFLSYSELGVFNMASVLVNSFYLTASSLFQGYVPFAYEYLNKNPKARSIPFYRKKIIKIILIFVTIFTPLSYLFLIYYQGGNYKNGIYLLPVLFLAQIFLLLYSEKNLIIVFLKKTHYITVSVISGSTVSILLILILMKAKYNFWVAAIPMLIGYFVQYIIANKLSKKQ